MHGSTNEAFPEPDTRVTRTGSTAVRPRGGGAHRAAAAAAVALLAVAVASCGGSGDDALARERKTGYRGVMLEEPVPRPDFTLTDTDGEPYSFAEETRGKVALLFFGYTHCPDVCPAQMDILGGVYEDLPPSVRERVEVVFVSADPARDSLSRIRSWLDRFAEDFVGLRGPKARVDSIQRSLGLQAAAIQRSGRAARNADGYAVSHGSAVLAFPPEGPARLAYPFGTRQRDWAHDLPRLVKHGWSPE